MTSLISTLVRKAKVAPQWLRTTPDLYLYYLALAVRNGVTGWKGGSILFYPQIPKRAYAVWKICQELGVRKVGEADRSTRLAVAWYDGTFRGPGANYSFSSGLKVINQTCPDISKTRVGQVFESVFMRDLIVDPTTHRGECVEKADRNGTHSGRIVQCPLKAAADDFVYQRIIDNTVEVDGQVMVVDHRVVICGNAMPLVYRKFRLLGDRFSNTNTSVEWCLPDACFSMEEIGQIIAFARAFGVDYAEIDVLRDGRDGKIYIVDVNYTPSGPPNHLSTRKGIAAIKVIAEAFGREFGVGRRQALEARL